ncbi:MAG TPA: methyl-accepting chemotaxis protein [Beijerinckiaceae bacterium]
MTPISMTLKDMSLSHKIVAVVLLMGLVAAAITGVGWREMDALGRTMRTVGVGEEAAREAMDLRVDIIAISRMTYQVAQNPERASDFKVEANRRIKEMLERFPKLEIAANAEEDALLKAIRKALDGYFSAIQSMVDVAASAKEVDRAVMTAEVEKGLAAQRAVTDTVKAYSIYSAKRMDSMRASALESADQATRIQIGVALVGIVLGVFASLLFARRSIVSPVRSLTAVMRRLAEGDLTADVGRHGRRDEIGQMADAVRVFKDGMRRNITLERETAEAREAAEAQRKRMMLELADTFEQAVGDIVERVSRAASGMQQTAEQLTTSARQTSAQSTAVAAAAEEASANVVAMSSATEELGNSVSEIGRQVGQSAAMSREAVVEAGATAQIVGELREAATKVGNIVEMISTIAGQTNLLALNATIEAARAGEAGRGFAVVASEVKALADQTARATGEISSQIASIQASTTQAVQAIGGITERIRQMSDVAGLISSAVDQQGAATREILGSVGQASAGTGQVTANITEVAQVAEETEAAATKVLTSSSELVRDAEHLQGQVESFLRNVRAA